MIEQYLQLIALCKKTIVLLTALISLYMGGGNLPSSFGGIGDTASSTPVFINYSSIVTVNSDTLLNSKIDETIWAISQDKPLPDMKPFKVWWYGYVLHKQGASTVEHGKKIFFTVKVNGKDFTKTVTQSDILENNKTEDWK